MASRLLTRNAISPRPRTEVCFSPVGDAGIVDLPSWETSPLRLWCHNTAQMASTLPIATQENIHRIQRVQAITIGWMSVEAAVSLAAAWIARSPALLAFGGDSAI